MGKRSKSTLKKPSAPKKAKLHEQEAVLSDVQEAVLSDEDLETEERESTVNESVYQDGTDNVEVIGESANWTDDVEENMENTAAIHVARSEMSEKPAVSPGLYRPVTREEVQMLKETENLYQSNLFRLQINELLEEVSPKYKGYKEANLEEFLKTLKKYLTDLPSTKEKTLSEAVSSLKSVKYPLLLDGTDGKGWYKFVAPSSVRIIGSWILKSYCRKSFNVDIAIEMPSECFQKKDYMNYRYIKKRALYLCTLAKHLRKLEICKKVYFEQFHGDPLRPIISITPSDESISCSVRIVPYISDCLTKTSRLAPDRNSVRELSMDGVTITPKRSGDDILTATPKYNNKLILDTTGLYVKHLEEIYIASQECEAFSDALLLLKIWLKQRQFDQAAGSFSGFITSMLLVYLLQQKKLTPKMSSYQILRVTWQFLASSDWSKDGIAMTSLSNRVPPVSSFQSTFDVVFVDSSGLYNLCGDVSLANYRHVQYEAKQALTLLDDRAINSFEMLFMTPVNFYESCHLLCCIDLSPLATKYCEDHVVDLLDNVANVREKVLQEVLAVLREGMQQRSHLVAVKPQEVAKWLVSKVPTSANLCATLGFILDASCAFNPLNKGPPADSKEALQFSKFWGDKCQVRRFQDGSINEAVLWSSETMAEKRTIPQQIIAHLLKLHFGMTDVVFPGIPLEALITLPDYKTTETIREATGEEHIKDVIQVFSSLASDLRRLDTLPLMVNTFQGTSPVFRYTEVFPPIKWSGHISRQSITRPIGSAQSKCFYPSSVGPVPKHLPALEAICTLEYSAKWPNDLSAILHIKTAFYARIAEELSTVKGILASPTSDFVDILKNGFVFRVRIAYEREVLLMKNELKFKSGENLKRYKSAVRTAEMETMIKPKLTSALSGIHHQYPSYGSGARLCKRWLASQMFANHLSEEAVDLMVASLYISPGPHSSPATPECTLLRFLKLFKDFDWNSKPLIVNINGDMTATDIAEAEECFSVQRASLPAMVILSPYNKQEPYWTKEKPLDPVSLHMQLIAKKAYEVLLNQFNLCKEGRIRSETASLDFKQIFRSSPSAFDAMIYLNPKCLSRRHHGVDWMEMPSKKASLEVYHHFPVVDFDPVQNYLIELEGVYSEYAAFFYDKYGGSKIGIIWKPNINKPRPFRVSKEVCMKEVEKKGKKKKPKTKDQIEVVTDVEAILQDFHLLGHGLVTLIEVLRHPEE